MKTKTSLRPSNSRSNLRPALASRGAGQDPGQEWSRWRALLDKAGPASWLHRRIEDELSFRAAERALTPSNFRGRGL
jgi:hypothetical protein